MSDADSPILIQTMRDLIRTIKDGSVAGGTFGGSKQKTNKEKFQESKKDPAKAAADRLRLEKAMKEGTKALKDTFKSTENYARDMKVASGMFQTAIGKLSLKAFDALPKKITALTSDLDFEFKTTADIQKTLRQGTVENITAMKALHAEMNRLTLGSEERDAVERQIQKNWNQDITLLALPTEKLQENFQNLGLIVNDTTKSIDSLASSSSTASKAGTILAEVLLFAAKRGIDATIASAKFGVEIAPLGEAMLLLGMSANEVAELQNKNIQAIRGAGLSFSDFDNMLISGAYQLAAYTGSMKDGAIIFGDAFRNFRMLSSASKDQNKFIDETAKIYKFMHETVGTTAEEFQQLTQTLMSSNEVQTNMYRLNEKQRTQAYLDLLTQDALLKTYGLLEPEAQAVVQTFAQIGAQGPKERLKQAAQLQAVGGALGMGKEAAQLAAYIRSGDTNNPEAIKLASQLQQGAQKQYANVKGTAGEFAQYALTNLPGVQQILGQSGPMSALGTRAGMATPPAPKLSPEEQKAKEKDDERRKLAVTAVGSISDQIKGISTILEVIAATLAIPTLSKMFGGLFTNIFSKVLGRGAASVLGEGALAAGGEAGAVGIASAAGLGTAATAVAGAAIVGAGAYGLTTLITDTIPKALGAHQGLGEWIGGEIADATDWISAKMASKSPEATKRDAIVQDMIKDRAELQKGGLDDTRQKELLDQLDALTRELAKMNGKDPAGVSKAVDDLHKTLKQQHQENKEMTQEQTNSIKRSKEVRLTKTSSPIGNTM